AFVHGVLAARETHVAGDLRDAGEVVARHRREDERTGQLFDSDHRSILTIATRVAADAAARKRRHCAAKTADSSPPSSRRARPRRLAILAGHDDYREAPRRARP